MAAEESIGSRCMFNEAGNCMFHAAYPTKCNVCFNFSEPGSSRKPIVGLMDYLADLDLVNSIFPKGNSTQTTL